MKITHVIRKGVTFVVATDEELVSRVQKAKARGFAEVFWTSNQRQVRVERRSDADLYQRMMAAKGVDVRVGVV